MAIKRKVRMAGESLAVTIPSQIAQLHDIKEGDYLEFTPIGYGEFKIKKVEKQRNRRSGFYFSSLTFLRVYPMLISE